MKIQLFLASLLQINNNRVQLFLRRGFLVCYGLIFFVSYVKGQSNGLYIGLERSPQLTWLSSGQDTRSHARLGDQWGLLAHYDFYKQLGIAIDAIWSTQQTGLSWQGTDYRLKNKYLKIPLQLNYTHLPMGPFTLIGRIGPELSWLRHATLADGNQSGPINAKEAFHKLNLGAAAYAGFRLTIVEFVSLNLGLRFDHDFSNVMANPSPDTFPLKNGHYNTLALVFGVNILHFR